MFDITKVEEGAMLHKHLTSDIETQKVEGAKVPKGAVWELNTMFARDNTGRLEGITLGVKAKGDVIPLAGARNLDPGQAVSFSGAVLMMEGACPHFAFHRCTTGDDLEFAATWRVISTPKPPVKKAAKEVKGD